MERILSEIRCCPDCKQIPKHGACACKEKNGRWAVRQGVPGTEVERAMLAGKGFTEEKDADGDVYYCGPGCRMLWLYPDGKWSPREKVSQNLTLKVYLQEIS